MLLLYLVLLVIKTLMEYALILKIWIKECCFSSNSDIRILILYCSVRGSYRALQYPCKYYQQWFFGVLTVFFITLVGYYLLLLHLFIKYCGVKHDTKTNTTLLQILCNILGYKIHQQGIPYILSKTP